MKQTAGPEEGGGPHYEAGLPGLIKDILPCGPLMPTSKTKTNVALGRVLTAEGPREGSQERLLWFDLGAMVSEGSLES